MFEVMVHTSVVDDVENISTADLAEAYVDAYAYVSPLENAFRKRVTNFFNFVQEFNKNNGHCLSGDKDYNWAWYSTVFHVSVENIRLSEGEVHIQYAGDEIKVGFEEMDNIESILEAKLVLFKAAEAEKEAKSEKDRVKQLTKRRTKLVKKLAKLDAELEGEENADV